MKELGFEEQLERSREILERLMDPEITLEESVKLYEEGMETIHRARKMIEEAKLKVEQIEAQHSDGEPEE
ncbi:exodeoxyribonuclease VII small subunit [Nitratifractor salsuginis]|uniref:Exodeoxyribonuclease 7 small subunit n=1 Tax=Nitratifractor salsuginis (strain DSM 16511 / JCM 12458 / E9I37-1) TaxID=749222 RepID=E6X0B0_NITSE|nr:exodeoxyribonuclease VII small subunit [Nitratifractor salsuginis]ADV45699.1 Exonuclease VII small subunit [Nitratifractor salsuginis DSM 16511]